MSELISRIGLLEDLGASCYDLNALKRGDMVVYIKRSNIPLKVISDPFDYEGEMVVNARTCEKNKNNRTFGLYAVNVLKPYTMEDTNGSQTD